MIALQLGRPSNARGAGWRSLTVCLSMRPHATLWKFRATTSLLVNSRRPRGRRWGSARRAPRSHKQDHAASAAQRTIRRAAAASTGSCHLAAASHICGMLGHTPDSGRPCASRTLRRNRRTGCRPTKRTPIRGTFRTSRVVFVQAGVAQCSHASRQLPPKRRGAVSVRSSRRGMGVGGLFFCYSSRSLRRPA